MSTVSVKTPATTRTVVPVTCDACGEDMVFTVTYTDIDHRRWTFDCIPCGHNEDAQHQVRQQLWFNQGTLYLGSYWGPDE